MWRVLTGLAAAGVKLPGLTDFAALTNADLARGDGAAGTGKVLGQIVDSRVVIIVSAIPVVGGPARTAGLV